MNKNTIVAVIIGLVIGVGGTVAVGAATKKDDANKVATSNQNVSTTDHNAEATAKLKDLKGDKFDEAFIKEMTMHHQGAIDMAKLIDTNAKHDELKTLGQDIISAQTKEIEMMQMWQTEWGYKSSTKSYDMHDNGH